ncbi:sulfatase-like hydrolase/transferase [Sulfitobacter geojensis]|uniref:Sulfatase-like hydrolase/transferase n=1 Tax=Sulfitobacter geojensis TaxID=1342299 RepID=A0AAE2W041_9RHOB|nr:sulfatase-like hydrolase/transferase [Sulfitobacter geojensis]MBM1690502.1 sulfatase-like hydrolase/transferase [Sulfitobacter geojensis]MBM1694568.1 sulfatase-like hydrolase/transferase [Sulfitobacter geojensis]MBM1706734.1 sulfatase-like hydrolase/transferase [Sulfitobacter geojensis]MBM1710792.1 sulfatase-like hydrolase/transferase [Sulfitobacter geojensis]MBM1714858.1 sulfatase-like hydrolase/transferase [Sulfitobacter geojensis]
MSRTPNVLWIMADQLRFDYLSCYGHPHLHTPHIDALAKRGVQFDKTYVQSPVCGPSRMSAYTGRYVRSHGATWNGMPLRVGEPTLGDHLRSAGARAVLVGKTHMTADQEGMAWLGIDPASEIGVRVSECGFEAFERDDGLHPDSERQRWSAYDDYLVSLGYKSDNPWEDFANSGLDEDGELMSAWLLKNSRLAANVPEEHSETAYMTNRAIDFMTEAQKDGTPWMCHLSYIKPHWPYIVPAPYHDMYGSEHIVDPIRSDAERTVDHPLLRAYQNARVCKSFSRDHVREHVIPAYMGLIKQLDDNLGRLFAWMDETGLSENTIIAFTSDHGDYMGDHWMGDKDFYHEVAVKVPLIITDPRPQADATRGTRSGELVEMIDLAPTFLNALGGAPKPHILEGRDLTPLLHGTSGFSRRFAISEHDYSSFEMAQELGVRQEDARTVMIHDGRWKYIRCEGFAPVMFDLETDPQELRDIGSSDAPEHVTARAEMECALTTWALQHHTRITATADVLASQHNAAGTGILIGFWDAAEFEEVTGTPFDSFQPIGKPPA